MKTLDLQQGSAEWLEVRGKYHTASEASILMGQGKVTREELVRMRATGSEQEFSRWVEGVLFAEGHRVEEQARAIAEEIIGDELYPVTAISDDGELLASLDGLTMGEDIAWECKQWNMEKARKVSAGELPAEDAWQVIQQLVVTGAEKCLYMVTDGTEHRCEWMYFSLHDGDEETLRTHWKQFDADVAAYEHTEVKPEPVGRAPEDLPALRLQLTGEVTASNLEAFTNHATEVFRGIKTELTTDEDFANAEKTAKWCKGVEDQLEAAKASALEQTASIGDLFKAIDQIKEEARAKRLELDKLVKAEKMNIRGQIIQNAASELYAFLAELCEGFPVVGETIEFTVPADFAGAMKGKRTVQSLKDAAADCLAEAKVRASTLASGISANLNWYVENYHSQHHNLFPDLAVLAQKESEHFRSVVINRVEQQEAKVREQLAQQQAAEVEESAPAEPVQQAPAADPEPPRRAPSFSEMLSVLANHYGVTDETVIDWLQQAELIPPQHQAA